MAYVKTADLACGWCTECERQIGDYPVCGPWPVATSIWLHTNGTGHTVRRISHAEAWAALQAAHQEAQST